MTATDPNRPRLQFDPHDPTFEVDGVPFEVLNQLRHECPVYRTPRDAWYLSRYADIEGVLKDVETFRADLSAHSLIADGIDAVPREQLFLSEITEPRHGKIRRLYNSCFAAHRARDVEPFIHATCHDLIDSMATRDVVDLHADYALPIPGRVMAHVLGLGTDAAEHFMEWSMDGSIMLRPASPGMGDGGPPIQAFFKECLARQRALPEPDNHVFRVLLEAVIDGEPLTDREIVTQLHFMIQAGVHTTRTLLTHLVHRPLHEPQLYATLRSDRELVPRMVEESLRHDSPVQRTTRRAMHDATISGCPVHVGDVIEIGIASGSRDETVIDDGESFRLDREDPRLHLGFGAGPHVCPGATLARLEAVVALNVLFDRVESMKTVAGVRYPPIPGSLGHQPIPAVLAFAG